MIKFRRTGIRPAPAQETSMRTDHDSTAHPRDCWPRKPEFGGARRTRPPAGRG